jgi:hypothetical protein
MKFVLDVKRWCRIVIMELLAPHPLRISLRGIGGTTGNTPFSIAITVARLTAAPFRSDPQTSDFRLVSNGGNLVNGAYEKSRLKPINLVVTNVHREVATAVTANVANSLQSSINLDCDGPLILTGGAIGYEEKSLPLPLLLLQPVEAPLAKKLIGCICTSDEVTQRERIAQGSMLGLQREPLLFSLPQHANGSLKLLYAKHA